MDETNEDEPDAMLMAKDARVEAEVQHEMTVNIALALCGIHKPSDAVKDVEVGEITYTPFKCLT